MSAPVEPVQRALPKLSELSAPQVRGRACVWCAVVVSAGHVVDLGPRYGRRAGQRFAWFPRACDNCGKAGR